jgi:hypothetical protein
MTMNTATTSNRIAAGVTAAFVRDLSRRSAPDSSDGRRAEGRRHHVAGRRLGRDHDDCGQRRHETVAA